MLLRFASEPASQKHKLNTWTTILKLGLADELKTGLADELKTAVTYRKLEKRGAELESVCIRWASQSVSAESAFRGLGMRASGRLRRMRRGRAEGPVALHSGQVAVDLLQRRHLQRCEPRSSPSHAKSSGFQSQSACHWNRLSHDLLRHVPDGKRNQTSIAVESETGCSVKLGLASNPRTGSSGTGARGP